MKDTSFHEKHELFTEKAFIDNLLPDRYVFVLTNQCNLRCKFCFQEKTKLSTNLTTKQWIDLINEIPDYARITFTGGEPFMFKGFEEVFKKAIEKHTCNIISNGLLLNDEIINLLLSTENFKVLSISLEDKFNANRGVNPKMWKETEKQIKKFVALKNTRKLETILDIKTIVLDENADSLYEMYKYAKDALKCDTHAFQFLKGSPLQHSDKMYDITSIYQENFAYKYKNFEVIKNQLFKIAKENPKHVFVHPKFIELNDKEDFSKIDIINSPKLKKDCFQSCKFPWSSVHINYDGSLYPCMSIPMGNVKENSLKEIIFSTKFNEFKDILREKGLVNGCNRCGWLRLKK
ncbi:radical SAM protein [Aliarcobacter cryaerophilus]|uniref:radical SAM protein n=1 Tax=Aliarcobacter cryaerophilus TaxID=28198 RepID=UPI000830E537|nr:radical SAM protein [Aliarcobacter cryaerophilus]